jgi:hypothetical protein
VVNGKLEGTRTSVGGLRNGKSGRYEGMVPLEYEIVSRARPGIFGCRQPNCQRLYRPFEPRSRLAQPGKAVLADFGAERPKPFRIRFPSDRSSAQLEPRPQRQREHNNAEPVGAASLVLALVTLLSDSDSDRFACSPC